MCLAVTTDRYEEGGPHEELHYELRRSFEDSDKGAHDKPEVGREVTN